VPPLAERRLSEQRAARNRLCAVERQSAAALVARVAPRLAKVERRWAAPAQASLKLCCAPPAALKMMGARRRTQRQSGAEQLPESLALG
jgi:hypothetical protein